MKKNTEKQLKLKIRIWIFLFVIFLILSGITAFSIETELSFLVGHSSSFPEFINKWIGVIYDSVKTTNTQFPFLAYGTDWLAFAHIVIATAFIGPLIDPVKNVWVIQFGMIACIMVFPLAFIAGPIRNIPFYWQLIDCSFGVFGIIPLYLVYRLINKLIILNK